MKLAPGPGSYDSFSEFGNYHSKHIKKDSESSSKGFFDKSKRSQYLSERNSLSNNFLKFSKSDNYFNNDYEENEKPVGNYMKFLEKDEEV